MPEAGHATGVRSVFAVTIAALVLGTATGVAAWAFVHRSSPRRVGYGGVIGVEFAPQVTSAERRAARGHCGSLPGVRGVVEGTGGRLGFLVAPLSNESPEDADQKAAILQCLRSQPGVAWAAEGV
jgi:hypothetical protein